MTQKFREHVFNCVYSRFVFCTLSNDCTAKLQCTLIQSVKFNTCMVYSLIFNGRCIVPQYILFIYLGEREKKTCIFFYSLPMLSRMHDYKWAHWLSVSVSIEDLKSEIPEFDIHRNFWIVMSLRAHSLANEHLIWGQNWLIFSCSFLYLLIEYMAKVHQKALN